MGHPTKMGAANTGRRDLKKLEEPTGQVCVIDAAGCELLQQRVQRAAHLRDRGTRAITQRRARVTGIKSRLVTSTDSSQTLKMQKKFCLAEKDGRSLCHSHAAESPSLRRPVAHGPHGTSRDAPRSRTWRLARASASSASASAFSAASDASTKQSTSTARLTCPQPRRATEPCHLRGESATRPPGSVSESLPRFAAAGCAASACATPRWPARGSSQPPAPVSGLHPEHETSALHHSRCPRAGPSPAAGPRGLVPGRPRAGAAHALAGLKVTCTALCGPCAGTPTPPQLRQQGHAQAA